MQGLHAAVLVALGKNNSGLYKALFLPNLVCFGIFGQEYTEEGWPRGVPHDHVGA